MGPTNQPSTRIVKSTVVTFLVGPQKFPMTIHTGAFENLSIELSDMVNDSITKGSTAELLLWITSAPRLFRHSPSSRTLATILVSRVTLAQRIH